MEKVLRFLRKVLATRIKMLENMNNPAIGYYYLHVNGSIRYMSLSTVEGDGGQEFLDKSPKIVKYWFIEDTIGFQNMVVEAKKLNDYIHG